MSHPLKVAMFSNHFVAQKGEGIARYANQLHDAMKSVHSDIALTPVSSWRPQNVQNLTRLRDRLDIQFLPWGKHFTGLSWTFLKRPYLESGLNKSIDIVHPLSAFYPVPTRKPLVVTVHDIMPITHPEFFPKMGTGAHFMKAGLNYFLKRADAIICVSQSTANAVELYAKRSLGNRVHVIWEGADPAFLSKPDMSCLHDIEVLPNTQIPFVLSVGGIVERKNIERLIQALESLKDEIPHHLVLVGGSWKGTEKILRRCRESVITDRIHYLGYVSNEQLHALYCLAKVFVYASLFEGFGLPVVEAMATGCPVVTSNISSLPEVVGDAALLVDPYKISSIAGAIGEICTNEGLAKQLSERGRLRERLFRWDTCAGKVADIYRRVA